VVVGGIGSNLMMNYTAIGDTVKPGAPDRGSCAGGVDPDQ